MANSTRTTMSKKLVEDTPELSVRQALSVWQAKRTPLATGLLRLAARSGRGGMIVGVSITMGQDEALAHLLWPESDVPQEIGLITRSCRFGGRQWFWVDAVSQGLCRSLFFDGRRFGSRRDVGLSYRSTRESKAYAGLLRRLSDDLGMPPKAVREALGLSHGRNGR